MGDLEQSDSPPLASVPSSTGWPGRGHLSYRNVQAFNKPELIHFTGAKTQIIFDKLLSFLFQNKKQFQALTYAW